MTTTPKKKKPRRLPAPGGGRAIWNIARIIIEHRDGHTDPPFLQQLIRKQQEGGA